MNKRRLGAIAIVLVGFILGGILQPFQWVPTFAQGDCKIFSETGKQVCGRFLDYWMTNGGLAQQGLPLTNEFIEISDLNGQQYDVQYFERAVFEKHPENQRPYDVLLSQLGTFRLNAKYPGGDPSGSASPPKAPTPIPVQATPAPVQPTQVPASGPPSDEAAFASYIKNKYPRVGSHTLIYEDQYVSNTAGIHYVSLQLGIDSVNYMLHDALHADLQAWGDAVLSEAKAAWGADDFIVSMEWTGYTDDPCFSCSSDCYYVSEDYTSGRGWYYSYTIVNSQRILGHERVLVCEGK